jgi:hypothetical protein
MRQECWKHHVPRVVSVESIPNTHCSLNSELRSELDPIVFSVGSLREETYRLPLALR